MIQAYKSLVKIIESDTLVDAARALHVTQPTLTRQIQQLERSFGMVLFDRVGKRLVLNRAGELVYRYARHFLALEQKMMDELTSFLDPNVGTIYMGAGLTPSIYLLPPLLAAYRKAHADVQFQVRSGSSREVCDALLSREVDVGVVTTVDDRKGDFHVVPIVEDDLLMVAAPDTPLARKRQVSFAEVCASPMVLMRESSGLRHMVSELTAEYGLRLNVAMETDSLESLNRLVQHGVGVSVLPRSAIQDDLTTGRLIQLELSDATLGARTVMLVTRFHSTLPAVAAQFAQHLPSLARGHHVRTTEQ